MIRDAITHLINAYHSNKVPNKTKGKTNETDWNLYDPIELVDEAYIQLYRLSNNTEWKAETIRNKQIRNFFKENKNLKYLGLFQY